MTLHDFLLVVCFAGGMAGIIAGAGRRDIGTALLGLVVVAVAVAGLF